jgi:hypothetical protein
VIVAVVVSGQAQRFGEVVVKRQPFSFVENFQLPKSQVLVAVGQNGEVNRVPLVHQCINHLLAHRLRTCTDAQETTFF